MLLSEHACCIAASSTSFFATFSTIDYYFPKDQHPCQGANRAPEEPQRPLKSPWARLGLLRQSCKMSRISGIDSYKMEILKVNSLLLIICVASCRGAMVSASKRHLHTGDIPQTALVVHYYTAPQCFATHIPTIHHTGGTLQTRHTQGTAPQFYN